MIEPYDEVSSFQIACYNWQSQLIDALFKVGGPADLASTAESSKFNTARQEDADRGAPHFAAGVDRHVDVPCQKPKPVFCGSAFAATLCMTRMNKASGAMAGA